MPVHIVITNPRNGDTVYISSGYVQAQGSIDASCTVTASINDGGVVQSSGPTHYNDPQGTQIQWNASIPTGGLTAGDWATLTASAKADDGSGVSSQTINILLQGAPHSGPDGAVQVKAGAAKALAGKKKA
jgi:hypothetical protein